MEKIDRIFELKEKVPHFLERLKGKKNLGFFHYCFQNLTASFLPGRANIYYYGTNLTKGLDEPDIHGTVMFLWGISIIAQILRIKEELGFKEQIP